MNEKCPKCGEPMLSYRRRERLIMRDDPGYNDLHEIDGYMCLRRQFTALTAKCEALVEQNVKMSDVWSMYETEKEAREKVEERLRSLLGSDYIGGAKGTVCLLDRITKAEERARREGVARDVAEAEVEALQARWDERAVAFTALQIENERLRTERTLCLDTLRQVDEIPLELDEKGHAFKRIKCRSIFDLGAQIACEVRRDLKPPKGERDADARANP